MTSASVQPTCGRMLLRMSSIREMWRACNSSGINPSARLNRKVRHRPSTMKEKLAMEIVNEVRSEQVNTDQTSIGATTYHEKASNGRPSTESSRNMPDYTILT